MALLSGCGSMPSPSVATRDGFIQQPPPRSVQMLSDSGGYNVGSGSRLYSQEPLQLRKEVGDACAHTQSTKNPHFLRNLVADLYFSGVDPAAGTEALLLANCGALADILNEMVARGGETSVIPIVDRAQAIHGPGAIRVINAAAQAGLAHVAGMQADDSTVAATKLPAYGMVYFPSAGEFSKVDTAIALNRLYEDAIPGYGLYTFVVFGRGMSDGASNARSRELLRVIETYVTVDKSHADPHPETPAFLIPIHPENVGKPLINQVAFDLSEYMRQYLGASLRRSGQTRLASSLEQNAGPFLVSSLEPRIASDDPNAPRLITDLSRIGVEYLYGVIDAYDRPIPLNPSDQQQSLIAIRDRLQALPIKPLFNTELTRKTKSAWVYLLGQLARAVDSETHQRVFNLTPSDIALDPQQEAISAI
ncbi:hypothetical protein CXB77_07485 [Chromatium okenii]|uniref:Uncharacterized protein n=2 Tax=Chromatium okenii TaxID=61644 RepID=A0A2S7XSA9_9GAMM|nr:hypothetical protein CXB77_07485 [Chromatium okenii]